MQSVTAQASSARMTNINQPQSYASAFLDLTASRLIAALSIKGTKPERPLSSQPRQDLVALCGADRKNKKAAELLELLEDQKGSAMSRRIWSMIFLSITNIWT